MVRLRGKWVEPIRAVGTPTWMSSFHVAAQARRTDAQRLQGLALIATKQEAMLQMGGMMNPVAPVNTYHNTWPR
jgi:hypothetical protein